MVTLNDLLHQQQPFTMRRWFVCTGLIVCLIGTTTGLFAQEKRALIVGINIYAAPSNAPSNPRGIIKDLKGAVNDARAMQAILINRFQFSPAQIDTLYDQQATREAIFNGLKKLLAASQANDHAVFFYAGHGSQVKNSLSSETDQKDETLVPADAWKPGSRDIRDKELAVLYNQFLDKGINLTVINDCCHSGSLSRGPQPLPVFRFTGDASYDAMDSTRPTPPETRPEGKFMILSAAQSDELAQEQPSPDQLSHGAFTLALSLALEQLGPNASSIQLFTAARAILKSNGKKQEPVLGATLGRQEKTLFGMSKGDVPDFTQLAVMDDPFNPMTRKKVFLQGGFAVGIRKGNELMKRNGADTLVYLIVDSVYGPNKSHARLEKGDLKNLKAGEYLTVTNWVSSQAPLLQIYAPPALPQKLLTDWIATGLHLKKSFGARWVTELDKADPEQTIYAEAGRVFLNTLGQRTTLDASAKAAAIQKSLSKERTLYFELPPTTELVEALRRQIDQRGNPNIQLVNDPSLAQYWLIGILDENNQLAYRLRQVGTAAKDSLGSLPLYSQSFPLIGQAEGNTSSNSAVIEAVAANLYEKAKNISKIRGWLQLAAPLPSKNDFPFQLVIRDKASGQVIEKDAYRMKQSIQFFLETEESKKIGSIPKRYVYLFIIDRDGKMTLIYPYGSDGNVDNQFPKYRDGQLVRSNPLRGGSVGGPIGTDNYMLLTTDEAIPNYTQVLNQEGVRSVKTSFALKSVLMIGLEGNTRSNSKTPANWSLTRRSMVCTH